MKILTYVIIPGLSKPHLLRAGAECFCPSFVGKEGR